VGKLEQSRVESRALSFAGHGLPSTAQFDNGLLLAWCYWAMARCYYNNGNTDMGPAWRALTHHASHRGGRSASFVRGRRRNRQMGSCDMDPSMVLHEMAVVGDCRRQP
jgi:hypothetical protein